MLPLVSVMMPCYNGARTLPWALASLVAQTYTRWECLFIDDGSTDGSSDLVERLADPRIRIIRPGRNAGRGAARQLALDHASGSLLCMIDADDWVYPTKIEHQVEVMTREEGLALVSTGFAVVDARGELAGVRASGPADPLRIVGPVKGLSILPVPFAASMVRTHLARTVGFDSGLRASEDVAFLIDLLQGRRYAIMPEASYAYHEYDSVDLEKMVLSLRMIRRVYRTFHERSPMECRLHTARTCVKEVVYRAGFALGLGDHLIRRRSRPPSARECEEHLAARRVVGDMVARLFPAPAAGRESVGRGLRSAAAGERWMR